jgi:hypothetical protein
LREEVRWHPRWSLLDGLASTIRWWQNTSRPAETSPSPQDH